MTWALAVTQTVGYGVLYYTFGVAVVPMESTFGWTRDATSGAFSLMLLMAGVSAWTVGRLLDRGHARVVMTTASLTGALLLVAWANVTALWQLYAVMVGLGVVLAASAYEAAFTVLARWMGRYRMRSFLVVTAMAGLASTIFVPATNALIERFSWQTALLILALLMAGLAAPLHAAFVRRPPDTEEDMPEASLPLREARRMPAFRYMTVAFAIDTTLIVTLAAHAVPLFINRGFTPADAALAAGSLGLLQVFGRLVFAPASERLPLSLLATVTYGLRIVAIAALLLHTGPWGVAVFVVTFGLSNGASTLARAGLVAERFGTASFGAINGSMTTIVALARPLGPWLLGVAFAASGGYASGLWGLLLVAVFATWAVHQSGRTLR